jgi:peptidoglycan/LPS O-acetylase OafA/YrhL
MQYRADIDGLRAVAVVPGVLFHLDVMALVAVSSASMSSS